MRSCEVTSAQSLTYDEANCENKDYRHIQFEVYPSLEGLFLIRPRCIVLLCRSAFMVGNLNVFEGIVPLDVHNDNSQGKQS